MERENEGEGEGGKVAFLARFLTGSLPSVFSFPGGFDLTTAPFSLAGLTFFFSILLLPTNAAVARWKILTARAENFEFAVASFVHVRRLKRHLDNFFLLSPLIRAEYSRGGLPILRASYIHHTSQELSPVPIVIGSVNSRSTVRSNASVSGA